MRTQNKIKLQIYNCDVIIIVTDVLLKEAHKIYKKYNIPDVLEEDCEGLVVSCDLSKYIIILNDNFLSHNTIAHEVYHVVVSITKDREIKEEEAAAWLAGHLTGVIYKFLEKKNLKVKHG